MSKVLKSLKRNKVVVAVLLAIVFVSTLYFYSKDSIKLSENTDEASSEYIESGYLEEGDGSEDFTSDLPGQYQTSPICNLDVHLVMDASRSMLNTESDGRAKIVWAREAATAFVNRLAQIKADAPSSQIKIGLTQFGARGGGDASIIRSLRTDFASIRTGINSVRYYGPNGTCISCGLTLANNNLINSTSRNVKRAVILLSDGCGNRTSSGRIISIASARLASTAEANRGRQNNIIYYTVGYSNPGSSNCGTPQYNEPTLLGIAGSRTRHYYRPDVRTWVNTFEELALESCEPTLPPTPTSFTPSPTRPTSTPTNTPTSTPTYTPTNTPTYTPTNTSTPTPTFTNNIFNYKFRLFSQSSSSFRFVYWLLTPGINPASYIDSVYVYRWDNVVPPASGTSGYTRRVVVNPWTNTTPSDIFESNLVSNSSYYYKICAHQHTPINRWVCTPANTVAYVPSSYSPGTVINTFTLTIPY